MLFIHNILLLLLLLIAAVSGYLVLYNFHINRRLRHESGLRLPAPGRMAIRLSAICATAVILLGFLVSAAEPAQVQTAHSWLRVFTAEDLPGSWAGVYSQDGNPGYTRREVLDGDFSFIIFESAAPFDGLHPDFLIYFRPNDVSAAEAVSWHGEFEFTAREQASGLGAGGMSSDYYLAVGSAEEAAVFTLTVAASGDTDSAAAFNTMMEHARESPAAINGLSSVSIRLHDGNLP